MDKKHVVVVGGGITGLVAAYRLGRLSAAGQPLTCTLIEKEGRFGGKIATKRTDDYTLELGPDSIYTRKPAGMQFLREIGLADQVVPVNPSGGRMPCRYALSN